VTTQGVWGSQSWLQPPFEAAPRSTRKPNALLQGEISLTSKEAA